MCLTRKGAYKDPYTFDFLGLGDEAQEREIERGLLTHLRDFLIELGVGFAFVGNQYHLELEYLPLTPGRLVMLEPKDKPEGGVR